MRPTAGCAACQRSQVKRSLISVLSAQATETGTASSARPYAYSTGEVSWFPLTPRAHAFIRAESISKIEGKYQRGLSHGDQHDRQDSRDHRRRNQYILENKYDDTYFEQANPSFAFLRSAHSFKLLSGKFVWDTYRFKQVCESFFRNSARRVLSFC